MHETFANGSDRRYEPPTLSGTVPLATERLDLRRFKKRDAQALRSWTGDPESMRFLCARCPRDVAEAEDIVTAWRSQYGDPLFLLWCVQLAGGGEAIGKIGATIDEGTASAEVEYVLSPGHRGQGYASEALAKVIEHLHGNGIRRVQARIHIANKASIKVVESAGMELEGIMQCSMRDRDGNLYDAALYAHVA